MIRIIKRYLKRRKIRKEMHRITREMLKGPMTIEKIERPTDYYMPLKLELSLYV